MRERRFLRDSEFIWPGKNYLAVAQFRSAGPAENLPTMVTHVVNNAVATSGALYPRFVLVAVTVHPAGLGEPIPHVAEIEFTARVILQGGLSFPMHAGDVRRALEGSFRTLVHSAASVYVYALPDDGNSTPPPGPVPPPPPRVVDPVPWVLLAAAAALFVVAVQGGET